MIRLDAETEVPDRPFAALASTVEDLAVMERMLTRLERHLGFAGPGGCRREPRRQLHGSRRPWDPSDRRDRCGSRTRAGALVVVGFFGQARLDVDHGPIVDLESALIADMAAAVNPLVYYNVHWPGVGWGNLVLFTGEDDERTWGRDDPRHAEAVARSPAHYHSIRLHVGSLPGGIVGRQPIELRRTRYFDFSGPEPWRAVRDIR